MSTRHTASFCDPIVVSVVHKDPLVRAGVVATLSEEPRFAVQSGNESQVQASETALLASLANVDVAIADYDSALTLARALKQGSPMRQAGAPKIMIVTQRDGESDIRHALGSGIQGYLPLGCHPEEVADGVVALHRGQRRLGQSVAQRVAESFDHEALTSREVEVLRLVVAGCANKTVASSLNIALGTVKVHVQSIMGKLNARTRTEAAAVAQRRGLIGYEGHAGADASTTSHAARRTPSRPAMPFN